MDFALCVYNEDTLIITGGSKVPVTEMLKFSLEPKADGKSTLKCEMLGLPHLRTKVYNHYSFIVRDHLLLVFGKNEELRFNCTEANWISLKSPESFFEIKVISKVW